MKHHEGREAFFFISLRGQPGANARIQAGRRIKALKGLQGTLGLLHDCAVLLIILRSALFSCGETYEMRSRLETGNVTFTPRSRRT